MFSQAHLECRGLILSGGGEIHAIPELQGMSPELEMSHEAAVGKISEEEIEYLMARGMTSDEATATPPASVERPASSRSTTARSPLPVR